MIHIAAELYNENIQSYQNTHLTGNHLAVDILQATNPDLSCLQYYWPNVLVLDHSLDNFGLSTEPTLELLIILLKLRTILLFLLIQVSLYFVSVLEILFLVSDTNLIYSTLKKLLQLQFEDIVHFFKFTPYSLNIKMSLTSI